MKNRSLRILHVCPRHAYSGLESWVLDMILAQRKEGADSRLVVLAGSPLSERATASGIPVFEVSGEGVFTLSRGLSAARRAFHFQILHLHGSQDFKALIPWIGLNKRFGPANFKVILQLHIWLSHPKRDPLHRLAYRLIDEVWCSSERARASLANVLPIPENKLRIVNYGRHVEKLLGGFMSREEARAALKLPSDAVLIVSVARIDRGKGTGELVDGSLAAMRANPKLHLVVIGSATEAEDAQAFARTLFARIQAMPEDLRSRIHLLGNVADSYRYLRAFDLFALPTYAECFSLALLEAQLANLPVLATNAGGSPEMVIEGVTGWLCEPESVASFEEGLNRALKDPALWGPFGTRARARVERDYDTQKVLQQTLSGYDRLLQSQITSS